MDHDWRQAIQCPRSHKRRFIDAAARQYHIDTLLIDSKDPSSSTLFFLQLWRLTLLVARCIQSLQKPRRAYYQHFLRPLLLLHSSSSRLNDISLNRVLLGLRNNYTACVPIFWVRGVMAFKYDEDEGARRRCCYLSRFWKHPHKTYYAQLGSPHYDTRMRERNPCVAPAW